MMKRNENLLENRLTLKADDDDVTVYVNDADDADEIGVLNVSSLVLSLYAVLSLSSLISYQGKYSRLSEKGR